MKIYSLTMAENEITLYSNHGPLFTPDIIFDGPALSFVPNVENRMLVGVEFMKGLYSVELCRVGDALNIPMPDRIDLDCTVLNN